MLPWWEKAFGFGIKISETVEITDTLPDRLSWYGHEDFFQALLFMFII